VLDMSMKRWIARYRVTVALPALCVAWTACGNKASESEPPPPPATGAAAAAPDPCSLLTIPEASSALGGPAVAKIGHSTDRTATGVKVTEKTCEWDLVTSDQMGHDIWVGVFGGADRNYFDQMANGPAIPGLGEAAKGTNREVFAFRKGSMIVVYGSVLADDGLQTLARLAIAKL
jgi:hypothetical protein